MNSNSLVRVLVRVQKKYFFEFKFEFGKMIEFFQARVQVRVRSPAQEHEGYSPVWSKHWPAGQMRSSNTLIFVASFAFHKA